MSKVSSQLTANLSDQEEIGHAGDYKCDGCPDAQPRLDDKGFSCKPMSSVNLLRDNTLQSDDPAMDVIVRGGWRNRLTLPVIEKLGIPIMDTWNQSVPLWEYHHGFQVLLQPPTLQNCSYSKLVEFPTRI